MKNKEKNRLSEYPDTHIFSLKQVQNKILKKEYKVDEKKIFDFAWSEGKEIKTAKKDKKKGKHTQLDWVFYNPSHVHKRVEDVY
jgi:hypothetical protein